MAEFFKRALLLVFTPQCFEEYFTKFNFLHGECAKSTISKGLGLGIIAGSVTVKVPQILKIAQNKSGEGISVLSVLLDLFAISSSWSYSYVKGYPFSAWGETMFLAVQTLLIGFLVLHYSGKAQAAVAFILGYAVVLYALISGITSIDLLWSMQVFNVPIIIAGKGLQAFSNFKNKSTGQLSAATCWLLFLGAAARIFTSVQETGDMTIIVTYIVATLANGTILAQLLYYSRAAPKPSKKSSKKVQ